MGGSAFVEGDVHIAGMSVLVVERVIMQRAHRRRLVAAGCLGCVMILSLSAVLNTSVEYSLPPDVVTLNTKPPRPSDDPYFATSVGLVNISFTMTPQMESAWGSVSHRVSFATTMSSAYVAATTDEGSVVSHASMRDVSVTITLYGKSSIKLKYTKRRSLEVRVTDPRWLNAKERAGLWPGAPPITRFLLLSLWEDRFRLGYRASAILLSQAGLFYAANRLVLLSTHETTLGAYLALEYPSDAIHRHTSEVSHSSDSLAPLCASLVPREVYAKAVESSGYRHPGVEVATRNWFYFEKPPNYDLLHVPSYKRNSSLSSIYRAIERDPLHIAGTTNSDVFFDVDRYLAWVAVNTLLRNGDYDDEVFFYRVGRMVSIMAWDYDNIFTKCHRDAKRALRTDEMFCAESPLESLILNNHKLHRAYLAIAGCLLRTVATPAAWDRAVETALLELQAVLGALGGSAAVRATFAEEIARSRNDSPPDVVRGAREIKQLFAESHRKLSAIVERITASGTRGTAPPSTTQAQLPESQPGTEASECHSEGLRSALNAWIPNEYKGAIAHLDAPPNDVSASLHGPRGRVPLPLSHRLDVAGAYCATLSKGGCHVSKITVVRSAERGKAEFGVPHFELMPFKALVDLPLPGGAVTENVPSVSGLSVMHPTSYWPSRLPIPIIVRLTDAEKRWLRINGVAQLTSGSTKASVHIVRGYSAALLIRPDSGDVQPDLTRWLGKDFVVDASHEQYSTTATHVSVTFRDLQNAVEIPTWRSTSLRTTDEAMHAPEGIIPKTIEVRPRTAGSSDPCVFHVSSQLRIAKGSVLIVRGGCSIVMGRGATLTVEGSLRVIGTATQPAAIVPVDAGAASHWDTILVHKGGSVVFEYTFVCGSGSGDARGALTGKHHDASAAITAISPAHVILKNSFFVNLGLSSAIAAGGEQSVVEVTDSLIQFAHQGIECVRCNFSSIRSVWSHFGQSFADPYEDHDCDAMYLSGGAHRVIDSVIANTRDDGIDSGTPEKQEGRDGGSLTVQNCIVESVLHEGIALSSATRNGRRSVSITNTLLQNCQQGIEVGYTNRDHIASVSGVVIRHTAVGLRYGDNYHRMVDGRITLRHSLLIDNAFDVFNYVRKEARPKSEAYLTISDSFLLSARRSVAEWPCVSTSTTFQTENVSYKHSPRDARRLITFDERIFITVDPADN